MTKQNKLPNIVLFGRPNVGKSTLFNRLVEKNHALVSDIPGTTRDINENVFEWQGRNFHLVDTGGILDSRILELSKKAKKKITFSRNQTVEQIDQLVQQKAKEYIEKADLIIFMVDVQDGMLPQDKELVKILQKNYQKDKKIIVLVNKADNPRLRLQAAEFHKLGLDEPFVISATTGSGIGDLLDHICNILPGSKSHPSRKLAEVKKLINVSIIGKPNVGKSSLVNAILGEDKIIVSPVPHTTREPSDTLIEFGEYEINLIDTAGISKSGQKSSRKKASKDSLEKLSIHKSIRTLKKSEIGLLVIDINEGLSHQETKLVEEITKTNTSLIIIANKWDLIKERDTKAFTQEVYRTLPFATWAPILFVSALTGSKVQKILDLIIDIHSARQVELSEKQLDRFLLQAVKKFSPKASKGIKKPFIYKLKQEHVNPPQFSLTIGARDSLQNSYIRYIANQLREKFKIKGTPISIYIQKKGRIHGEHSDKVKKELQEKK